VEKAWAEKAKKKSFLNIFIKNDRGTPPFLKKSEFAPKISPTKENPKFGLSL